MVGLGGNVTRFLYDGDDLTAEYNAGTDNTGRFQYTGQISIPELGMYHCKVLL